MRILITGASGALGRHLVLASPLAGDELLTPSSSDLDVTDERAVVGCLREFEPNTVIHCAARIRSRGADSPDQRLAMSRVNVYGAGQVARAAKEVGARLVHVSTDFVFDGSKPGGLYRETDVPCPLGYYPLTKAAAEPLALGCPGALVVRLSFNESWPYPRAFSDRFTSKLPVAVAAHQLALAAKSELSGLLHLGGPRRSYLEFARTLGADVEPMTLAEVDGPDPLPVDTSLDTTRWRAHRHGTSSDA